MSDSVTEVTKKSWFGRIGGALIGGLIGLVLFFAAFPVLIWNEGSSIKREKTLQAGGKAVIDVPATPVDSANEGKLVHVTGEAVIGGSIRDSAFGVSAEAIKLRRNVEMYQWTEDKKSETKKNLGGSEETVTTYTYKKEWSSSAIDSSEFHQQDGHENPGEMPVESEVFTAKEVKVGDFVLSDSLVDKIDDYDALPVNKDAGEDISADLSGPIEVKNGGFYVGKDPTSPAVGDLRIKFEEAKPGPVSIVAAQVKDTFEPYIVKGLGDIELLQTGTVSAQNMFENEQQGNVIMSWILRFVGFFMMFLGIVLMGSPLAVIADIVPFFGNILEAGIGLLALVIAFPLTLCTIALAWLAYRPLLGVPLLILAVAGVVFGIKVLRSKRALKAA